MVDAVCIGGEPELRPNSEDDLLDAEVSALFHNYLQMSEVNKTFIRYYALLNWSDIISIYDKASHFQLSYFL